MNFFSYYFTRNNVHFRVGISRREFEFIVRKYKLTDIITTLVKIKDKDSDPITFESDGITVVTVGYNTLLKFFFIAENFDGKHFHRMLECPIDIDGLINIVQRAKNSVTSGMSGGSSSDEE